MDQTLELVIDKKPIISYNHIMSLTEALNGAFNDAAKSLEARFQAGGDSLLELVMRMEPKREHGVSGVILRWAAIQAIMISSLPLALARRLDVELFKLGADLTGGQQKEQEKLSSRPEKQIHTLGNKALGPNNPFKRKI